MSGKSSKQKDVKQAKGLFVSNEFARKQRKTNKKKGINRTRGEGSKKAPHDISPLHLPSPSKAHHNKNAIY